MAYKLSLEILFMFYRNNVPNVQKSRNSSQLLWTVIAFDLFP